MKKFIIAIDPGNKAGFTYGWSDGTPTTEMVDFTPKKASKTRDAEPEHVRYGNLFNRLHSIYEPAAFDLDEIVVICEDAAGFTKGKAAVQVSNQYRGVVKAFAHTINARFVNIQPNDLQRYATGKGRAEKTEMMEVARVRHGYQGKDDNEADSIILFHFAKEHSL